MKPITLVFACLVGASACNHRLDPGSLTTHFERSGGLETVTYSDGIAWWKALEKESPYVCVQTSGETDAGYPLHVVVVNASRVFAPEKIQRSGKRILFINNGIHPGEPDGIDASMLFVRDLLERDDFAEHLDSTVLVIIPFYNIGGALHRGCCSRASQNGPLEYGFRGNARNLDLNRDFIKCDSRNALSFSRLFHLWNPDVYLETHVSNGADYPYTMTFLSTHPDRLSPPLNDYVRHQISPAMYEAMKADGDEMIPYVNVFNAPPDSGYAAFNDSPRYSSGYVSLFHTIGILTETHMLKPYDQRVESTRRFMHGLCAFIETHGGEIRSVRTAAQENCRSEMNFCIEYECDSSAFTPIPFSGYEAYMQQSKVTGLPQLFYDRSRPFTRVVKHYDRLREVRSIRAPAAYLVPVAWGSVVERMKANGVDMRLITRDTSVQLSAYRIGAVETSSSVFEGHYPHHGLKGRWEGGSVDLPAYSYYVASTNQLARRFLIETLEPEAPDSYFNWNFFDEVLQQKEWFSTYVFDAEAEEMLANPDIRQALEARRQRDSAFAQSAFRQYEFLYHLSPHYERERHRVYPVFRIE